MKKKFYAIMLSGLLISSPVFAAEKGIVTRILDTVRATSRANAKAQEQEQENIIQEEPQEQQLEQDETPIVTTSRQPDQNQKFPEHLAKRWNELSDILTAIYNKSEAEPLTSTKLNKLNNHFNAVQNRQESKELTKLRRNEAKLKDKRYNAPEKAFFRSTRAQIENRLAKIEEDIKNLEQKDNNLKQEEMLSISADIQKELAYLQGIRDNEINLMLDRAIDILVDGRTKNIRKEAAAIQAKNAALNNKADDLRNKRITVIDKSANPWVMTKQKIDKQLEKLEIEIKANNDMLDQLNFDLLEEIHGLGVEAEESQISFLLNSITGDDFVQNIAVFSNVKSIVGQLQLLMTQNKNNLTLNRRYLGMYVVLNDIVIYVQKGLIRNIDNDYMPRLKELIDENALLRAEAEKGRMTKYKNIEQQRQLQILLAKQDKTLEAGQFYMKLLEAQRKEAEHQIEIFEDNRELADLAYNIEQNALGMIDLVNTGFLHFDSIKTMAMPSLQIFEDDAAAKELEVINARLKAELKI